MRSWPKAPEPCPSAPPGRTSTPSTKTAPAAICAATLRRRGYTVRYGTGDDARYDTRPGTAKPLLTDALEDGDPMDCELYPVVWRHGAGGCDGCGVTGNAPERAVDSRGPSPYLPSFRICFCSRRRTHESRKLRQDLEEAAQGLPRRTPARAHLCDQQDRAQVQGAPGLTRDPVQERRTPPLVREQRGGLRSAALRFRVRRP